MDYVEAGAGRGGGSSREGQYAERLPERRDGERVERHGLAGLAPTREHMDVVASSGEALGDSPRSSLDATTGGLEALDDQRDPQGCDTHGARISVRPRGRRGVLGAGACAEKPQG